MDLAQGLDRRDPDFGRQLLVAGDALEDVVIPGIAAGRDEGDPLRAGLGIVEGLEHDLLDGDRCPSPRATRLRGCAPRIASSSRLRTGSLTLSIISATRTAASGDLIWPRTSSAACCSSGAVRWWTTFRSSGTTSLRWIRQARPRDLRQRGGRLVGCARRDERLVAVDREVRRDRDVVRLARPIELRSVSSPKRLPSKRLGQVSALALLERQAEGLEIPAVLAVPGGRQLPEGLADLVGGQVAEGQDQLAADAGVGIVGQGQEGVEMGQGRGRLLGLGLLVLDLAVLAAVAAEHPHGQLAEPGIVPAEGLRLLGHHGLERPQHGRRGQ